MLSVITPTLGRDTLARLIESAPGPWHGRDEWLIVEDTRDGARPWVRRYVESLGRPFRYLEHASESCWGHPQRNFAIGQARVGNYLVFNDDTDEFAPGALAMVREEIKKLPAPGPLLFTFQINEGVYSATRHISEGTVGGHQFVAPNLPGRVGSWGLRYEGDYDFIRDTLALWGGQVTRVDRLISQAWE